MSNQHISAFKPDNYNKLYKFLLEIFINQSNIKDLYLELNKFNLQNPLDLPKPSNAEKSELENGNATISGVLHKVNKDFINQALQLSSTLNISHHLASSLLQHGMQRCSRYQTTPLETAVILFHSERLELVRCLQLIINGSTDPNLQQSGLMDVLNNFTVQLIQNNFINTLISSLKSLKNPQITSTGLNDAVTAESINFITLQRQELAHLLYLFAFNQQMSQSDITSVINYASTLDFEDSITPYILSTLLAAFNFNCQDLSFITNTLRTSSSSNWLNKSFKAVFSLRFALFIVSSFQFNPNLASKATVTEDDVEKIVLQSINDDAFLHLQQVLINATESESPINVDFKPHLLFQLDMFITQFITTLSPVLRKLKHREEDLILASSRSRSFNIDASPSTRQDLAQLYFLIALLYRNTEPESALKFWVTDKDDYRLFAFLRWSAEARTPLMVHSLFEMIGSLASGTQCATYVYEFLSGNTEMNDNSLCSWNALFGALDFYANNLNQNQPNGESQARANEIPPEEVDLLKAFLFVLKQVVGHSSVARAALIDNPTYKPIQTLFSLLACSIPVDLKSSLFDTLASFASAIPANIIGQGSSSIATENAKKIWVMLESSQILPTTRRKQPSPLTGILAELEEIESAAGTYPISTSFINFLNNLIHTPAKSLTLRKGIELDSLTIPNGLGANHRVPGIQPFVNFVVDDIFLRLPHRGFKYLTERWKLTETSLCFIEKCLSTYDLSQLFVEGTINVGSVNEVVANPSEVSLCSLVLHPGFNVLIQFLSGGPILKEVFNLIGTGIDAILDNRFKTPFYAKSVQRCLRIIYRIISIQSMFLEVLLPLLRQQNNIIPGIGKIDIPSALSTLDQHLLFAHDAVIQIALYVNAIDEETSLLAVKTISAIAKSTYFSTADGFANHYKRKMNRLTGIIDSSDESLRILSGFVRLLEVDAPEDTDTIEDTGIETLLNSSTDIDNDNMHLTQTTRSVILDLLIENTKSSAPSPNIAHFLLGFNLQSSSPSEIEIEDPLNQSSKVSCLHVIFSLLAQGVENDDDDVPLFINHPILAEKCYRLIYQLCTSELTSNATLRYLRLHEDFFYKQLVALPIKQIPISSQPPLGIAKFGDGGMIQTSSSSLASFLRFRAWLLDTVALEIHALTNSGQTQRVTKLVDVLFSESNQVLGIEANEFGEVVETQDIDQTLAKILDIYQSLDLDYIDEGVNAENLSVSFFTGLDLSTCLKTDDNGSVIYDFRALLSLLGAARRHLQKSGVIASPTQYEQVKAETQQILEFLASDNRRRQVHHARQFNLEAWKRILDIICAKCFDTISKDRRETVLLNILQTILPKLTSMDIAPATSELLCGATLSLITKLRTTFSNLSEEDDVDQRLYVMPNDRLLSILKQVIEVIIKPGSTVIVRGNLYSVLHNYLQIVNLQSRAQSGLEVDSQLVLDIVHDKLIPIICRDAVDGSEVWKTVAFSVLDGLAALSLKNNSSASLDIMVKHGFLRNFVQSLKDTEDVLINIVQSDPESLNPLYVFEAKTAMLLRVAQDRKGAERLLDAQIFTVLAQCEFVSCRPSGEESLMDYESFLPPATERYHQLLLPTLQLASTVLSSVGVTSTVAAKEALGFVYAHREVFLEILRDNPTLTSLALVQEHHLIVCILHQVKSVVSDDELISPSGFGAFHTAILNLSTKYMTRANWINRVVPFTDTEKEDSLILSKGGESSKFAIMASITVENVNEWLLNYLTLTRSTSSFRPLLLPLFPQVRDGQDLHQASSSSPTLGQAITGLKELVSLFHGTLFDFREHQFKIQQTPSIHMEIILSTTIKVLKSRLTKIEMMLLLIWRHAEFYVKLQQKPQMQQSLSASLKPYGNVDSNAIAREISQLILPILSKLDGIELTSDMIQANDVRSRQAFLQIISRRIREAILYNQTDEAMKI